MKSDTIMQLQAMNKMMEKQFNQFPVKTIMVLGVAGGNGLEHIDTQVIAQIKPKYVSCVIQINTDDSFVSDSPCLYVFEHLDIVHHQIEQDKLVASMENINYHLLSKTECLLLNHKKLVQLNFQR